MPHTDEEIKAAEAKLAARLESGATFEMHPTPDLRAVADAARAVEMAEALLRERVALARAHGQSWTRVALPLGVSRQAARQRFGGIDEVVAGAAEVAETAQNLLASAFVAIGDLSAMTTNELDAFKRVAEAQRNAFSRTAGFQQLDAMETISAAQRGAIEKICDHSYLRFAGGAKRTSTLAGGSAKTGKIVIGPARKIK